MSAFELVEAGRILTVIPQLRMPLIDEFQTLGKFSAIPVSN